MKHESKFVLLGGALILKDHSPISILSSQIGVLTAYKSKPHRAPVSVCGRGDSPADPAAESFGVSKSEPVDVRRLQPADQDAARPVLSLRYRDTLRSDDVPERFVLSDFNRQLLLKLRRHRRVPSPQQNAVAIGISGCHAL